MDTQSKSRRLTIRDVAERAGLSPATVSKVLNDAPYVSGEARERVLSAVAELGFRPNGVARSLRSKHTLTLGLITDDLEGEFTASMLRGVEDAASARGFSVFLCNSYGEAARERAHLEILLDKRVDGVILMSGYRVRERGAPALPLRGLPVVYLHQYTRDVPAACVLPDDRGGAELATRHLVDLGRRRVALINGPRHYEACRLRFEGYRRALQQAGLPFDPALVRAGEWYEDSGYQLTRELMVLPQPPDAIFCTSDRLAAGGLEALRELGAKVPRNVAVVGFNNRTLATHQRPPLTTVALPLYEMGSLASELLVAGIEGDGPGPALTKVPCHLVRRESCGAQERGWAT